MSISHDDFVDTSESTEFVGMSARERFEIQANVSTSGSTFATIVSVFLLFFVVLGAGLVIRSLWLFTHPEFRFGIPSLPSFELLNDGNVSSGIKLPPNSPSQPLPNPIPDVPGVDPELVSDYLYDLRSQGDSLLDSLTNDELISVGLEMCSGVDDGFSEQELIAGFVKSMTQRFPNLEGFEYMGKSLFNASSTYLCPPEVLLP